MARYACSGCGQLLGEKANALMNGRMMGDEYTEAYYLCAACDRYTKVIYRDVFCEDTIVTCHGPIDRAAGDARVALIGRCAQPADDRCTCDVHREYFDGWVA